MSSADRAAAEKLEGNNSPGANVAVFMRLVCAVAGTALFACGLTGFAETNTPCSDKVSARLQPRSLLVIDSLPAGLKIVGTDEASIHVSCTAGNDDNAQTVQLHFTPTADGGRLSIQGTHLRHGNNNLEVTIEVPWRTNLRIRMLAGDVKVESIKGDKDIDLGAGQITISAIQPSDYRSVEASVSIGEVQARAFNSDKGGFFRSFTRNTHTGEYRIYAHVTTGEVDLLGSAANIEGTVKPD